MKATKIIGLFMIVLLALSTWVVAAENSEYGSLPIDINSVKVDGTEVYSGSVNVLSLERNTEFDVRIVSTNSGTTTINGIQIEAYMRGYDHTDLIEDITDTFDMKPGISYSKSLKLKLPNRMDQGRYLLRVRVEGQGDGSFYQDYQIEVGTSRHSMEIKDVVFSPNNEVEAGRALLTTIRLKNNGEKDEESVKVQVNIPELGVSASDYIDTLDAEDSTTSEEIYLRIPSNAKSGNYDVITDVIYNDGDDKITKKSMIEIVAAEGAAVVSETGADTVISVGAEAQSVGKGKAGVVYPITITNNAASSKTFVIEVDGVESFGSYKISPSNAAVVGAKSTETIYVYVSASDDAKAGDYLFSINIRSDAKSVEQVPVKVTVDGKKAPAEKDWTGVKSGLFYGLIALLVILVIIGLIIGFNKLKNEDEGSDEEKTQTYY